MSSPRIVSKGVGAFVLALSCWLPQALAASPEGRWRLVEQRYQKGEANMMATDSPLRLEFTVESGRLVGRMWAGDDPGAAVPWPAFGSKPGPASLDVLERSEDLLAGEATVRYEVLPAEGDDLVLEVTESYRVSKDGSALEGTMHVKFKGGERNRGGYTLHRRFEREK
jgi:hypothetical protein